MSNELHPIFDDIFKGIIKDKPCENPTAETTTVLLDILNENDFDTLDLLRDFINEVKNNPKGVIAELEIKCDKIAGYLSEKGICPLCGGVLKFEHDASLDTYVPYGDTQVIEKEGGILKCENCGYSKE